MQYILAVKHLCWTALWGAFSAWSTEDSTCDSNHQPITATSSSSRSLNGAKCPCQSLKRWILNDRQRSHAATESAESSRTLPWTIYSLCRVGLNNNTPASNSAGIYKSTLIPSSRDGETVSTLLELKCIFETFLEPISQLHKADHPDIRQGDNNLMGKYIKHFVQREQKHHSVSHSI